MKEVSGMKVVVVLMMVIVIMMVEVKAETPSLASLARDEWQLFKLENNKQYNSDVEDQLRMKIFLQNKQLVLRNNQLFAQNLTSFKLGLNHLADKLPKEITGFLTGPPAELLNTTTLSTFIPPDEDIQFPSYVDWRSKGAVTGVKSQGQCASGWAFATTGALEGQVYRHWKHLVPLSEQNLVDCCHLCHGCQGGRMDYAYTYILQNNGIDSELSYPYEARNNVCRYHPAAAAARVKGYSSITAGDEKGLMAAVATMGPVAVAIDASLSSFHYYTHGVYYDPHCSTTQLTHGALVVGYGRELGHDYWLVKNSWGGAWGDRGYIKMARNLGNNCGIATNAVYPQV